MKKDYNNKIKNEMRRISWGIVKSLEITLFIICIMLLHPILSGEKYIDWLIGMSNVMGKDAVDIVARNLIIVINITIILVFVSLGVERKSYAKLKAGINRLAKGDYSTRLVCNKYSSIEYRELIEQFNMMAQELGSTETLQKNFMNDVSHEFKTPIVSIKGFAGIIKKKYPLDEEGREYLDIIIQESNRLTKLSDNVLLLCKLEEQALVREKESFDLRQQLNHTILLLEREWEKKEIDIILGMEEEIIEGNKALLQQVWINLIHNAIKFSKPKTTITVDVKTSRSQVMVTIKDQGLGISEENLKDIFRRFYRVVTTEENLGNGIGLSIVKRVVELHNGAIDVESEVGKGTCFTVTLNKKDSLQKLNKD